MMHEMEENTLMLHRAAFGKQVEVFLSTDIGKYILSRAEEMKENAHNEFSTCDPENVVKVREIQNKILLSNAIVGWLKDAIEDGVKALNILED